MASERPSPADPSVRRGAPEDAAVVAALLHLSAIGMYDTFAGGRERALRLIERAFDVPGNAHSAEIIWVAEVDGAPAGAMAADHVEH